MTRVMKRHNQKRKVPTRTFSLQDIMDEDAELMNCILMGWLPDGNHLCMYEDIPFLTSSFLQVSVPFRLRFNILSLLHSECVQEVFALTLFSLAMATWNESTEEKGRLLALYF